MAYRVEFPGDFNVKTEICPENPREVSLPTNTGDTGDTGNDFVIGGRIIAVKICSHVLDDCIWLALDESFETDDGLAVFYAAEIPLLRDKPEETLRRTHEARLVFKGWKIVLPLGLQ
jgi:hypothetical protein